MGYDTIRKNIKRFDEIASGLRLRIAKDCSIKTQYDLASEFLKDEETLSDKEHKNKWDSRFKEYYDALIVVARLSSAVIALKDRQGLKKRLSIILKGSLIQNFEPQTAKDLFYELEMAYVFKSVGFDIELRDPDVVISSNGLSSKLGVACKHPSSTKQIHEHLSKGYNQITKESMKGFVSIGFDQLIFEKPQYLDFRVGEEDPLHVANEALKETIVNLEEERKRDYPAEKPLDGAILSLMPWGIYGKPAHICSLRFFMLQCTSTNPMLKDMNIVYSKLASKAGIEEVDL